MFTEYVACNEHKNTKWNISDNTPATSHLKAEAKNYDCAIASVMRYGKTGLRLPQCCKSHTNLAQYYFTLCIKHRVDII